MACDIANNVDELEELEVSESDAARLRDLLEELENEERVINKDENKENCLIESSVDESEANIAMFHEHVIADQQTEYSSNIYDFDWIDMVEASSMLQSTNDMAVSDWYGSDNTVGIVGFEHCNHVGDYSYMYNEMTYSCLWEDES